MKAIEERWNSRNEGEHGEQNFAGQRSGGGGGGGYKPKSSDEFAPCQVGAGFAGICYCCAKTGHFARDCSMREKTCCEIYSAIKFVY